MSEGEIKEKKTPGKYTRREIIKKGLIAAAGIGIAGSACKKIPGLENLPIASREHWKERIEDYPMIVVIETLTGENVNVHDEPMYLESSKIGQTPSNTEKEFEVYKVKGQLLPGHMSWKDPTGVEYGVWFSGQSIPNAEEGKPPLTGCIAADFVTIRERLKPGETKTPTP